MPRNFVINESFRPPALLRGPHVQSILSSTGPRKLKVRRMNQALLAASRDMILDCGDGVRLLGHYAPAPIPEPRGLVTLIHGWEGSGESNYMLSVSGHAFRHGYSVFRLNLRDHGPSHHLNRELFNSTRLSEVLGAMEAIQSALPYARNYLVGFSLGGNFSLRVGAAMSGRHFRLDRIIAVCPVICPAGTMESLEQGSRLYHDYFVHKWKRSLSRKLEHFPEYDFHNHLARMKSLREMNHYFVPNYTGYEDPATYFEAYSIAGDRLQHLGAPAHIITSADDPVVLARDLELIHKPPLLTIEVTRFGGHCGFIENLKLDSWIDRRILQLREDGEAT
jgi:predicted alpha/beta-fold hydrolase